MRRFGNARCIVLVACCSLLAGTTALSGTGSQASLPVVVETPPSSQSEKESATPLDVIYLGNEGFLVQVGKISVLVDALQGPGLEGYPTLPVEQRNPMEQAQAPFDAVDLVLITHHHPDHFNGSAVARFLRANVRALLISTPETVRRLSHNADLVPRLIALNPQVGNPVQHSVAGIDIEAFRLHHGSGRDIDNFGYRVTMGGRSWLHVGDTAVTAQELAVEKLSERPVDVFFVPYWHLLDDAKEAKLKAVGARQVVAMHLPSSSAPKSWFDPFADLNSLLDGLRKGHAGLMLFETVGERRAF